MSSAYVPGSGWRTPERARGALLESPRKVAAVCHDDDALSDLTDALPEDGDGSEDAYGIGDVLRDDESDPDMTSLVEAVRGYFD